MSRRDKGKYLGPKRTPDDVRLDLLERELRPLGECCARCRRGVKGFGSLPCGYDGACPNDCHERR